VTFLRFIASDSIELRGTARLLSTTLARAFLLRGLLLVVGGVMLPLLGGDWRVSVVTAALTLIGELTGRYLFFVSVVPKHMTTAYLPMGSEAAA
jgi:DMSO reductase anchor subunit